MSFDLETLYNLLPAVYRIRDLEQCSSPEDCEQPLRSLLKVIVEQIGILEENLSQLYDDQFIETCADWVVPYIGDLVGYKMPHLISSHNLRSDVANTLNYRKRKGTALLMEELLQGVTGWDMHIVEYFTRIAATQHVNRPSVQNHLLDLSQQGAQELELLGTPFEHLAHSVDIRKTSSRYGRYNVENLGVFVWRLGAYALTGATAARAFAGDAHRYRFSPLGNDIQLFNLPQSTVPATQLSGPLAVAMPIDRSMLAHSPSDYYGQGKSLRLTIIDEEGKEKHVPASSIVVGDLSDRRDNHGQPILDDEGNPSWATTHEDSIVIDPVLGRIATPKQIKIASLRSTFHYGFSADIGGGEYSRGAFFIKNLSATEYVPRMHRSITQALDTLHARGARVALHREAYLMALDAAPVYAGQAAPHSTDGASSKVLQAEPAHAEDGAVEITYSGSFVESPSIRAVGSQTIELRAKDLCRPLLILDATGGKAEMQISGDAESQVILNGLVISNGPLRVIDDPKHKLGRLILRHCTLVPGLSLSGNGEPQHAHQPSLIIDAPATLVEIDHCIIGAIHANDSAQVRITSSIVDATSKHNVAYAAQVGSGTHATSPGGSLSIENSTIIGRVSTVTLEASNTIFLASPGKQKEQPLYVARRQGGCVRYSFVPPGSRTPRCYQCQPQVSTAQDIEPEASKEDMEPIFTSLRYGHPGYCQLYLHAHENIRMNIRKGADDQSEMGVFHDLLQPQRAANLHLRLREYLPLTIDYGVVYMT